MTEPYLPTRVFIGWLVFFRRIEQIGNALSVYITDGPESF